MERGEDGPVEGVDASIGVERPLTSPPESSRGKGARSQFRDAGGDPRSGLFISKPRVRPPALGASPSRVADDDPARTPAPCRSTSGCAPRAGPRPDFTRVVSRPRPRAFSVHVRRSDRYFQGAADLFAHAGGEKAKKGDGPRIEPPSTGQTCRVRGVGQSAPSAQGSPSCIGGKKSDATETGAFRVCESHAREEPPAAHVAGEKEKRERARAAPAFYTHAAPRRDES